MGSKAYFIGIDAGTTVIKSALFDDTGAEVAKAQGNVGLISLENDWYEMDMNEVWAAVKGTVDTLLGQAGADVKSHIRAIGITGQGCGAWLIDRDGNPVRKAILWNDTRAGDVIRDFERRGVSERVYQITGCELFTGSQGVVLKWLSLHEPEALEKASFSLYCKDWIKFKLTGVISTDPSEASISYYDFAAETYSGEVLKRIGIEEYRHLLPRIDKCHDTVYDIKPELAEAWGIPPSVRVTNAPYDISASALGVGAISDGDACTILGTALISEIVIDRPDIKPYNVGYTVPLGPQSRWVRMVNTNYGTPNLDWFIRQFCQDDTARARDAGTDIFDDLHKKIREIPIGSEGILYNPFINSTGLKAPFLHKNAKAHFIGLAPHHTKYHLLRALFEGVALAIKHSYANIPRRVKELCLAGGGARSGLWCQIIADSLNVTVKVPSGEEFGAKGAAINAAVAAGYFKTYEEAVGRFVSYARQYEPNAENHQKYNALFDVYTQIYGQLKPVWNSIAALLDSGI
ncbi:L-xylulokinase [Sporobacter termitidis DSM 10068]|uniref:L-xylulokinase n=1 Tax=Sporobacter termitidis DSM 10068 TaxID=1123282 RepID=A0A1M5XGH1_9FIRM|nr:FGGY-family carbohydrate kinase [Sporobacter termitidis]SHH98628.1 L-xylulokinase [Sporobacter termitidis DSM 10068]